jgi:SAM-dependent methyltransferase
MPDTSTTKQTQQTQQYDAAFYEHVQRTASQSARALLPHVIAGVLRTAPDSVLDVGCGPGSWVASWLQFGVDDVTGIDRFDQGVPPLLADHLQPVDLAKGFALQRRFELVQCLEVAEHIPESSADIVVDSICAHTNLVVFGAASPGQGGDFHVNEQPPEYWRAKFAARGFVAYDALRPLIAGSKNIEPWYRYNTLVYANAEGAALLSQSAKETKLGDTIPNNESVAWKARRAAVRAMPKPVEQLGAWVVHRLSRR